MCNTFLHLASGTIPAAAGASPYENSYNGKIQTGAQGAVDWTSPNQTSARIEPGDVLFNKFEDLALWTETEGAQGFSSRIQGQGTLTLKGIFFTPNANPFALGGSSAGTIEADAQFWTRRLELSGPTKLLMAPDPEDAVPTPAFEGFGLIR
jgi:hypothetical protein